MHVLFVHKNYPAQFGHIAQYLIERMGWKCSFVSERPPGNESGIERIQYKVRGAAGRRTHPLARSFENYTWHSDAVYQTMKARPDIRPDLVVGHSGFGSTLFLADLYHCPVINYFEWYYGTVGGDLNYRNEFPSNEGHQLRTHTRNAMFLADLENCRLGYSPTNWQRSRLPEAYQSKLTTIFDGIDTHFWCPTKVDGPRRIGKRVIPPETRLVTYVSRGFESMRGFDIFMRVAKRICDERSDVLFVCVGTDQICYGGDEAHIKHRTFREHVLAQDHYDLERFVFTGRVKPDELVRILGQSDLHIYLTVPFVLSWSLMDSLSCGCTVLASDTAPIREMIQHGENGLLAPFYDIDAFVQQALKVLENPDAFRELGRVGRATICQRYSLDVTLPQMLQYYEHALNGTGPTVPAPGASEAIGTRSKDSKRLGVEWPTKRPKIRAARYEGAHADSWRELLERFQKRKSATAVLEIGAWTGGTTRVLAAAMRDAKIVATDDWLPDTSRRRHNRWKPSLPDIYWQFVVNCWEYKDRIVICPGEIRSTLAAIHASPFVPDLICINDDHSVPLAEVFPHIRQLFPAATVVGDNWCWSGVRDAIKQIVESEFLELEVDHGLWRLWPSEEAMFD